MFVCKVGQVITATAQGGSIWLGLVSLIMKVQILSFCKSIVQFYMNVAVLRFFNPTCTALVRVKPPSLYTLSVAPMTGQVNIGIKG